MNDDSGYAFANWSLQGDWQPGLTKREYYAGQAMIGMRSSESDCSMPRWESKELARRAVLDADALIAELSKSNGSQKE